MDSLIKIQSELKAPKNQFNKFGNYSYRSCEDILEAAKPLLKKQNMLLTINDQIIEVGGRVYVKATVTVKSKDFEHSVTAMAREPESRKGIDESQITGATSSYARKYALNGMFCIDDTKDSDTKEPVKETPKAEPKKEQETSEDDKKWLNKNTPQWDNAVEHLNQGYSIEDVYAIYKVNKANREELEQIANLNKK